MVMGAGEQICTPALAECQRLSCVGDVKLLV